MNVAGREDGYPDLGEGHVIRLIHACGDMGINFIDAAEMYGDGESERRVGKAIAGNRSRWLLSSKFGMKRGPARDKVCNVAPESIRRSLEDSLRRLRTDYLDVYLYHSAPTPDSIDRARAALEQLKQDGKIRCYGISTNDPQVLQQLVEYEAIQVVMFSQSMLTNPHRLLSVVRQHELGSLVRDTLESGKLSGKYFRQLPQLDDADIRKTPFLTSNLRSYAVYERFRPQDVSMTAFALRYVLDFETTSTIVLGGKSIQQYEEALRSLSLDPLDATVRSQVKHCATNLRQPSLRTMISARFGQMLGSRTRKH